MKIKQLVIERGIHNGELISLQAFADHVADAADILGNVMNISYPNEHTAIIVYRELTRGDNT